MAWLAKLKIASKLGVGFSAVLILTVALGVFSLLQLSKLNTNVLDIGTNWMVSITYISQLRLDVLTVRRLELNYFVASDKAAAQARLDESLAQVQASEKLYEPTIIFPEDRRLYEGFRSAWDKHLAVKDRIVELLRQGKAKEADALSNEDGLSTYTTADKWLAEDTKFNVKGGDAAMALAAATYSASRYWVIGILISACLIGAFIAATIARSISGATSRMTKMIQEVAQQQFDRCRHGNFFKG